MVQNAAAKHLEDPFAAERCLHPLRGMPMTHAVVGRAAAEQVQLGGPLVTPAFSILVDAARRCGLELLH